MLHQTHKRGGVKSLNFIRRPKQQRSRASDTGAAGIDQWTSYWSTGFEGGGDLAADGVKGAEL